MKKNKEISQRPTVKLDLKPHLEAFLRYSFNTPANQECIAINRRLDIGQLITCHVLISDVPVHCAFNDKPVTIILPVIENSPLAGGYHYYYVSAWGQLKISDGLEYEFRLWLKRRFEIGYEMNYQQKHIVEAVLRGLNIRNQFINYETIKKIDYRNRRKVEEKRFKVLLTDCK